MKSDQDINERTILNMTPMGTKDNIEGMHVLYVLYVHNASGCCCTLLCSLSGGRAFPVSGWLDTCGVYNECLVI